MVNFARSKAYDVPPEIKDFRELIAELNLSSEEALIVEDIISNLETTAAKGILDEKIVQIPYIGTLSKDILHKELMKKKDEIKEFRDNHNIPEYKVHLSTMCVNIKGKLKEQDSERISKIKLKQSIRGAYDHVYLRKGKEAAEKLLDVVSRLKAVPFDQEVEDAYQEIMKNEANL